MKRLKEGWAKKEDNGREEDGNIRTAHVKRLKDGWDEGIVYCTPEYRTASSNGRKLSTVTMRSEKRYSFTGKLNIVVCNLCDTPKEAPKAFSIKKAARNYRIWRGGSCHKNITVKNRKKKIGIFRISGSHFPFAFGNILLQMQPCLQLYIHHIQVILIHCHTHRITSFFVN